MSGKAGRCQKSALGGASQGDLFRRPHPFTMEALHARTLLSVTTLSGYSSYQFDIPSSTIYVIESNGVYFTTPLNTSTTYDLVSSTGGTGGSSIVVEDGNPGDVATISPTSVSMGPLQVNFDNTFTTLAVENGPWLNTVLDDTIPGDVITDNGFGVQWGGPSLGALFQANSLTINADSTGQTVNVLNSYLPTTVTASDASDTINVGGNSGYGLGDIYEPLDIQSGGGAIDFDTTGDTTDLTGSLTSGGISGFDPYGTITFSGEGATSLILGNPGMTLNVGSISSDTTIGAGNNTVNVGDNLSTLDHTVEVDGESATLNLNDTGDSGFATCSLSDTALTGSADIQYSGVANLNLTLGAESDLTVTQTNASTNTVINGGSEVSEITIQNDGGATTINTSAGAFEDDLEIDATGGATAVNLNAAHDNLNLQTTLSTYQGAITVTGSAADQEMEVNDSGATGAQSVTITGDQITGGGMASGGISYSGLYSILFVGGSGNDTTTIDGTSANLTGIQTGSGANTLDVLDTGADTTTGLTVYGSTNTINIQGIGSDTTIEDPSSHAMTVNVAGDAAGGGTLADIQGNLTIDGVGAGNLVLDDSEATGNQTGNLASSFLLGYGMTNGSIFYNDVASLTLALSDYDTLNVSQIGAQTTINSGNGTVNVGDNLTSLAHALDVVGGGNATLNLNDSADTSDSAFTLGNTSLSASVDLDYSEIAHLNITLPNDNNAFTVAQTAVDTDTVINTAATGDAVDIQNDSGTLTLNTTAGATQDGITIEATGGVTDLNTNATGDAVDLNGTLPDYQGTINVAGAGGDLFVNDGNDTSAQSLTLAPGNITGGGMGSGGITYRDISDLEITGGSGNNTTSIDGTSGNTTTLYTTGSGSNTVNILDDNASGDTYVALYGSADTVNIQGLHGYTSVGENAGNMNTINVGGAAAGGGTLDDIQGDLHVDGDGTGYLHIDDTDSTAAQTGTLSAGALTGFGMGNNSIAYTGVSLLKLWLGTGGNTLTVNSTDSAASTQIRSGSGNATVNVISNEGALKIVTNPGSNAVQLGSSTNGVGGRLDQITAPVTVVGSGNDRLVADDSGGYLNQSGTLTAASITGLSAGAISYSGIGNLKLWLGSGANQLVVAGTNASTATQIHAGIGHSFAWIAATGGPTLINLGSADVQGSGVYLGADLSGDTSLADISPGLTIAGASLGTLHLEDDSSSSQSGTVTAGAISGLGLAAPIAYSGFGRLITYLGAGNDTLSVTGASASTLYTFNGGNPSENAASIDFTGDEDVAISLTDFATTNVNVQGNFNGSLITTGAISTITIDGNFPAGASIIAQGGVGTVTVLGARDGTIST